MSPTQESEKHAHGQIFHVWNSSDVSECNITIYTMLLSLNMQYYIIISILVIYFLRICIQIFIKNICIQIFIKNVKGSRF
jgi:hypothetical protein